MKLPKNSGRPADKTFYFANSISKDGGDFTISLNAVFENNLKFTPDAPQKWSLDLPSHTWTTANTIGDYGTPIHVKIPKGDGEKKLIITLDLVVCKTDECIPKKLAIVFEITQKSGAPAFINEIKNLEIK